MRRGIEWVAAMFAVVSLLGLACDTAETVCVAVTRCSDGAPLVGVHFAAYAHGNARPILSGYTEPDGIVCVREGDGVPGGADLAFDKPGYDTEHRSLKKDDGRQFDVPPLCLTAADAGTDGG